MVTPISRSPLRANFAKDLREVAGMFDAVVRRYDLSNDVMSLLQVRMWHRVMRAAIAVRSEMWVLDLAAGTGTSSVEYAVDGAEAVTRDFSTGMTAESKCRHPETAFVTGDATVLPFADENFDVVTISYGLCSVQDTARALSETRRVTVSGGRIVIVEFSTPVWPVFHHLRRFCLGSALPAVVRLISPSTEAYDHLGESTLAWSDQQEPAGLMQQAGWQGMGYKNLSGGVVAAHRATRPASVRGEQ